MKTGKYQFQYQLMLMPAFVIIALFYIYPMFGTVIAFQRYLPSKAMFESEWIGLKYFEYMFKLPEAWRIFRNTMLIAVGKIVCHLFFPVFFALLINEIKSTTFKRTVQTVVYLPHFLSWVVLATPIVNLFSFSGIINQIRIHFGQEQILFMANNSYFRPILILTDTWKEFGFGTIVYLAAITGINPCLYEAAVIDGATRLQKIVHITLPGILGMVVLMGTRSLGDVLNAGFDQVFNLYSPAVYETADIIDTYVYRVGLLDMNYSLSTAVGLMKSAISLILILTSYYLANRFSDYRIF